jgi:Uncharacterised nucleotidyltransferase
MSVTTLETLPGFVNTAPMDSRQIDQTQWAGELASGLRPYFANGDVEKARRAGVLALLMPDGAFAKAARAEFARNHLLDQAHQRALEPIARSFKQPMLLIKGAHLAHALYADPGFRPRTDTDLWIDRADRQALHEVLLALGWHPASSNFGELELPERSYRHERFGLSVSLDVHWGISARPAIARALQFPRVWQRAEPSVIRGFFQPSNSHALLIASQHLFGHHRHEQRAIWLVDAILLWRAMDAEIRTACLNDAQTLGMEALVLAALERAHRLLSRTWDERLAARLKVACVREPLAALIEEEKPLWWIDWHSSTWRERAVKLKEKVFAEPEYLRARFSAPKQVLIWLQLRRWWESLKRGVRRRAR